jgi:hypothetical protein
LDDLHEFSVRWGLEGLGSLVVGLIAVIFYVLELIMNKLVWVGFLFMAVALDRVHRRSEKVNGKKLA